MKKELQQKVQRLQSGFVEQLAGLLISLHLGEGFESKHIGSDGESADCQLFLNDSLIGIVEVMRHTNPKHRRLFNEILKADGSEILHLPKGYGAWTCEMTLNTKFKKMNSINFCELIDILNAHQIENVHVEHSSQYEKAVKLLIDLDIKSIRRFETEGNFVIRHMPIVGGQIDDRIDLLADFAEDIVNDSSIQPKLQRLSIRADELQKHFCIVIDSESDFSVQWRMKEISLVSPLPNRPIKLPKSVDSLWVASIETGKLIGFSNSTGWVEYQHPNGQESWWSNFELSYVKKMKALLLELKNSNEKS